MSGVEVAGLALSALPVLIIALEQWRKTTGVLDDWWKIKRKSKKCSQDLRCAKIELEMNLQRFLLPLVLDDSKIAELMADPGGPLWRDPSLEHALRDRLPISYDIYRETVGEINCVVNQIGQEVGALCDDLELEKPNHIPAERSLSRPFKRQKSDDVRHDSMRWISKNIGEHKKRAKFAFRRPNRDKLFADLSHLNRRLQMLLDTNETSLKLNNARDKMKMLEVNDRIFSVWRYAEHVYNLLTRSFRCECKSLHYLHLKLHHLTKCTNIEFFFQLMYGLLGMNNPWDRSAIMARRLETTKHIIGSGDILRQAPPSTNDEWPTKFQLRTSENRCKGKTTALTGTIGTSNANSSRKKVGFEDPGSGSASTQMISRKSQIPLIDNVCDAITQKPPGVECLGMIEDQDIEEAFILLAPNFHEEHIVSATNSPSLADLLRKDNTTRLTRQQRYRIALTLASSHVQLFSTPWLHSWKKSGLLVASNSSSELYTVHPIGESSPETNPRPPRAAALQSLGILLLELCHGIAIEEYEARQAMQVSGAAPNVEDALDLAAALTWAPSVLGEAGERYADAVQWCLAGGGKEDDSKRWRKEVWENVVEPLQWSLEQFG